MVASDKSTIYNDQLGAKPKSGAGTKALYKTSPYDEQTSARRCPSCGPVFKVKKHADTGKIDRCTVRHNLGTTSTATEGSSSSKR